MKMSLNVFPFKIYRTLTSGWFVLENKYRFSCRASEYFAYSQGFVFQRKFELYLGVFEEGTRPKTRIYCVNIDVDDVLSHAVQLGTILSIIAQSVWCQTHNSRTDQMRTLYDEHELKSPSHLSSPEIINHSSHHLDLNRDAVAQLVDALPKKSIGLPRWFQCNIHINF